MGPLLMLHQSCQNPESEDILVQFWGGRRFALEENFNVTINLSKSQRHQRPRLHPFKVQTNKKCVFLSQRSRLLAPPDAAAFHRMMVMQLEFMHKLLYKKLQGRLEG